VSANVFADEFETLVESDNPPTVTQSPSEGGLESPRSRATALVERLPSWQRGGFPTLRVRCRPALGADDSGR
jgi:hypothetical protein